MKSSTFVFPLPAGEARVAFMAAPLLSVVVWLAREPLVRVAREQAERLAFVSASAVDGIVWTVCTLAPLLVVTAVVTFISRRAARATITPDHAVIRPMHLRWPVFAIPLVDVDRRTTPHGVMLHAPTAVPRLLAWLLAPLVPATKPEEVARAHGALDAPSLRPDATTASAGRVAGVRDLVALLVLATVWAVATETMRPVIGDEVGPVHALGAALLLVVAVLTHPARTRVFLGAETLSVGGLCVAWDEVTAIERSGRWFTLSAGGSRRAARVGAADAARLLAFARERLAKSRESRVQERLPRWLVTRSFTCVLIALALASVAVVLGPVRYRTAEACLVLVPDETHHDKWAAIIYRKVDGTPQLVVVSEGMRLHALHGPSRWSERHDAWVDQKSYDQHWRMYAFGTVEVDARLGTVAVGRELAATFSIPPGATVVHVSREGVKGSVTPLGAASPFLRELAHAGALTHDGGWSALEACIPEVQDPVLRDALDGVTSARCYAVGVPGKARLFAKLDHGRLVSAVIASEFSEPAFQCLSCLVADGPPRLVRIGGRRSGDNQLGDADLPTLAEVRAALVAVERGASVSSATETWPRAVSR